MKEFRKLEIVDVVDHFSADNDISKPGAMVALDYCGFEHCLPRHSYGPHIRKSFVIHVVIDGKGMLDYRGKRWMIGKGQMFILFPGEVTTYYADKDDPWYYCWIGFRGEAAWKIVESIGFSCQTPVLSFENGQKIEDRIKKILSIKSLTLDGQLLRNAEMLEILSDIIKESSERVASDDNQNPYSYSEYAVRYINNHFSEKIRIQDLANQIGISRSYLVNLMKRETGMSPQRYLLVTRMRRAIELLTRTNDSIRNIAAECGYDDPMAFSKVFKSKIGINPSNYREKHSNRKPE